MSLKSPECDDITLWGEDGSVAVGMWADKLGSWEGSRAVRRWEIYCSGRI